MPSTISEMMESYAAEAVHLAHGLGAALNYTESSLQELEKIFAQLDVTPSASNSTGGDPARQSVDSAARLWGAYFGETIRRLWGGEWGVETYPGTVAPVVSLDLGGAKVFPVMKVYRRLTQGEAENVWKFYQMVRARVSVSGARQ